MLGDFRKERNRPAKTELEGVIVLGPDPDLGEVILLAFVGGIASIFTVAPPFLLLGTGFSLMTRLGAWT